MNNDALQAACCLAGADGEVTVEELQVLRGLVAGVGLERAAFDARVARIRSDADLGREQLEFAKDDAEGTITKLMGLAHREHQPEEGHVTMLLWRIATRLDIGPERFDELLAAAQSTG